MHIEIIRNHVRTLSLALIHYCCAYSISLYDFCLMDGSTRLTPDVGETCHICCYFLQQASWFSCCYFCLSAG